jgi:hypothetical protein
MFEELEYRGQNPPHKNLDMKEETLRVVRTRARIFKLLSSPGIDSNKPIQIGCVAWVENLSYGAKNRFQKPSLELSSQAK